MSKDVQLQERVCWYPGADIHQRPMVAFVSEIVGDALTLELLGGHVVRGVRHISDRAALPNPQIAAKLGAYERIEEMRQRVAEEKKKEAAEREASEARKAQQQEEQRATYRAMDEECVEMATRGIPLVQICKTLSGKHKLLYRLDHANKALRRANVVGYAA